MFDDLDASLAQLLHDAPATEMPQLRNADVTFVTPESAFSPGQSTVDLFLYEVRENRELRNSLPIVERDGDRFTTRPAPVRADCAYIVTTWAAGPPGPARVAAEHQLLGQAVAWLSRFGTLPDRYLQGQLGLPDRIYPPPALVAQHDPNQNAGDFWVAMGIPPRPAFGLTVTVELDLGAAVVAGDLVTTLFTGFVASGASDGVWISIGGRVVDDVGGEGIEDAVVDVTDLSLRTRSQAEGRFSFPRVPEGSHTIRVVGRGFAPKTQPLVVPARPQDYLVELTPLP
jgi:Pvc16 N-terminal domain/Carboxypeptidase regulatory-like domain